MTRKWIDCRDFPDETGCTLYLSGEEEHVIQAGAEHAVSVHGAENTPELREWLCNNLKEEGAVLASNWKGRDFSQPLRS
jgi:uncharacterized protein DUF1059